MVAHPDWEVTIMEFHDDEGKKFKVTRRMPVLHVAETKIFRSKHRAKAQLEEWLQ